MHNNRPMKDSGIEWIGEIPEGWETRKVKAFYNIQTGFTPDTKQECYYADEDGIEWLTIGDLTDSKYIPLKTKSHISQEYINKYKPKVIPSGSLLYSFKLSVGQVAFTDRPIYSNEAIASFLPNPNVCLEYLFYSSRFIIENANENIYGAKILNQDLIKNAIVPIPPFQEQQKIANFLDKKCGYIDSVLKKTRASIEEYKQLKQSVITQAVTKGIRPNRPMKDSGIEWIGNIPEDWNIETFRHIFIERNEKNIPIKTEERLSLSIDKGITLYAEKTTNLDRFKDDFTQYKLAYVGDFVLNSMNMIVGAVGVSKYFGCISPAYYTYYNKCMDIAHFYEYLFKTKVMNRMLYSLGKGIYAIERGDDRVNTCRLKVSKDDLKSLKLPYPSQEEQREIVSYLDSKCAEIYKLIEKKEQLIEELETYKKSLIYEYVTGKKEVV